MDSDSYEEALKKRHSDLGHQHLYQKGSYWIGSAAALSAKMETVVQLVCGVHFVAVGELVLGNSAVARGTVKQGKEI